MLDREARQATNALDIRMRADVGLGPRAETPAILPLADNWMR